MAMANPRPGALAVENHNGPDPFVTSSHDTHRQRYSAFDNSNFSLYLNGSPLQAKRALKAHLAETTRRLQETSHLGSALVQQRKELEDKLKEVEQEQDNDIGPELRQRLVELEKEFNEVGRETARAFLPKSRVPSGETDTVAGASVYSSEAQHSPTKVSVPSRKQRNQQPSRINDIALATEISTSLLSQLKDLQAVLLQKDDALKATDLDRSQLEIEVEGLSQRLRTLDESESRLKDVNWGLETQVRESEAQAKSAADKEHRLNHALNLSRSEKSTLERELEEFKQLHTKLNDDHINKTKQHETELSSLRRNVAMGESERGALQRKMEELVAQNQELATAITYRMKGEEYAPAGDTSPDDGGEVIDTRTPEESPPPSPNKATPRHGMLESETLKHSLQHAHRMIQQLKNNIHREKTEKIELKRMLQDARDEIDTNRSANGPSSASKRRKSERDVFKKPARPDRLGALRSGTQEIVVDDEEWEEHEGVPNTPSRPSKPTQAIPGGFSSGFSSTEDFETANEASDAAFETANERDGMSTESDAFQTGAETLDGDSSDQLTETEAGPFKSTMRNGRSLDINISHHDSYESTASASDDDFDNGDLRTPNHSRFRQKSRQGSSRTTTPRADLGLFASTPPMAKDSPASFFNSSRDSTPAQKKSLFAELNDLSGDEGNSSFAEDTPSRSSMLHSVDSSPEAMRKSTLKRSPLQASALPKPTMVDSSTMTEREPSKPVSMSTVWSQHTQPQAPRPSSLHLSPLSSQDTSPKTALLLPLQLSSFSSQDTVPTAAPVPVLHISDVHSHDTLPQTPSLPALALSSLALQVTTPQSPPAPSFNFSAMTCQDTSPRAMPKVPLNMSSVSAHTTEPQQAIPPSLSMSRLSSHTTEPVVAAVQKTAAPSLDVSAITHQKTEPKDNSMLKSIAPAALLASAISMQTTEPVERSLFPAMVQDTRKTSPDETRPASREVFAHEAEPRPVPGPTLSAFSTMSSQSTEPIASKQALPQLSKLSSHTTEPLAPQLPRLQLSKFSSRSTEPVALPKPVPSQLSSLTYQTSQPVEPLRPMPSAFSLVSSQVTEPIALLKPLPSKLSTLWSQITEPIQPRLQKPQLSTIEAQQTEPITIPIIAPPQLNFSGVTTLQDTLPESPKLAASIPTPASRPSTANRIQAPVLAFSTVSSHVTEPLVPSRPVTAHRAIPVPFLTSTTPTQTEDGDRQSPIAPKPGFFDSVPPWNKDTQGEPEPPSAGNRGIREPLVPVDANSSMRSKMSTVDGGTQTMVSAEQIDKLLLMRSQQRHSGTIATAGIEKALPSPLAPGRRNSNEVGKPPRRPGSSGSMRSRDASPPPLPHDHKEVIAAAALKPVLASTPGAMGPPMMPASAYKKRPQTPSIKSSNAVPTLRPGGTTSRSRRQSHRSDIRSGSSSLMSRRSSLSSFTSEIDQRFNIPGGPTFGPSGIPAGGTDPRMIQAITQTMIGEFLWKYIRKTGREGISDNRHRRFFWIHPYTRTLYWSDRDPQSAGKSELKAKSVAIESVQEVDDNNPLPPGLHQKSLLVTTPGRSIKFTATTSQRHETWYNALSYLCQRVEGGELQSQQHEQKTSPTDEIQDEFNAGYRSSSRQTGRSRASMSSHVTRRTSSPHHTEIPTLRHSTITQQHPHAPERTQSSVSSRFSSILRPSANVRGSYSSRLSRASGQESSTYEEPSDTNMELGRDIHDHVERDLDGMPNVRACCDGKHDVGHLHNHQSMKGRNGKNTSSRPSLIGSISSRAQSRAESRNERIHHETEMEAANFSAGA